jgi:hypothetical protein
MFTRLFLETAKDFLDTSVFAWFVQPYVLFSNSTYSNLVYAILIAGVIGALTLLYSTVFNKYWNTDQNENETPNLIKDFLWIGSIITVCAILPVILSDRQVDLYDTYKSYGLHPIAGVTLFIAGIVLMFQPNFRKLIVTILVVLSVATQILNADNWKPYWEYQREMWWQFTWRAPDVQDGTLIMTYSTNGFNPEQDYEIWGPVNLIYNPEPAETPAIKAEVLNNDTAYSVIQKKVIDNFVRDIPMHREYNNVLLISMSPISSCLHVIDGSLPVYSEEESLLIKQIGEYSHIDRIITTGTPPVPPSSIFGSEPEQGWCYYYQKASLARQKGDWEEVGRLYDLTIELGLETDDKSEMIPYLEGLVNLGRYDEARLIYTNQIKGRAETRLPLCAFLSKDPGYPPEFNYNYEKIYEILCGS